MNEDYTELFQFITCGSCDGGQGTNQGVSTGQEMPGRKGDEQVIINSSIAGDIAKIKATEEPRVFIENLHTHKVLLMFSTQFIR
ncbi:hypothetical protein F8M41_002497 [Gigaspora margarita]|uniref:Uncharacterized protein n=1 Tax=Gigaspora margarita TaxID=4874 RepID=A0A8H3XFS7_GIGMA|nr:hypothetical protein F8M41_002497 [Gigaspora margarita]